MCVVPYRTYRGSQRDRKELGGGVVRERCFEIIRQILTGDIFSMASNLPLFCADTPSCIQKHDVAEQLSP